jgi:uncharacterized protein YgiM (DUF1202 family)
MASAGTFRATTGVRVRAEPSTDAKVITVVHPGDSVEVLNHDPAGWSRVQVGGSTGYIRSDFLRFPIGSTPAIFATTDGVNLRSSPSKSSNTNILHTVPSGTSVEVLEHDPAGWSSVRVSGVSGYIRSDFLTRGGSGAAISAPSASSSGQVQAIANLWTTGNVNMRSGSSLDDSIITTLARNTSVEVLENLANGWSRVRHGGNDGFIKTELLSTTQTTQDTSTRWVAGNVNLRSGASMNHSVIRTLSPGTSVELLESQTNGWSRVRHSGTEGFIKSDLLSTSPTPASTTLRTVTGVYFRTGPSTNHRAIELLQANTPVTVLENQSNGWSKVRYNGTEGFIKTEFLGSGARVIELIDWSTARSLLPTGRDLRVVDVRTGISYNIRVFSKGNHADVDTSSQADTDAKRNTRNGVWAWAPRPVWVTVGDRTFAAAINGMPHAGSVVSGNGLNGHFCLHFKGSTSHTSTSASYFRNMQNAVQEAYDARPR